MSTLKNYRIDFIFSTIHKQNPIMYALSWQEVYALQLAAEFLGQFLVLITTGYFITHAGRQLMIGLRGVCRSQRTITRKLVCTHKRGANQLVPQGPFPDQLLQ